MPAPAAKRAFVSFKTVPDLPHARVIADVLHLSGIETTFIQGDIGCPFPIGSEAADKWISDYISKQSFDVLVVVASQQSMRSKWVFQELYMGLTAAPVTLLLWVDGPDPTPHFFPGRPRRYRWFPCESTTYVVDCRGDAAGGAAAAAATIRELDRMRRLRKVRRIAVLGAAAFVMLLVFAITFALLPVAMNPLERANQGKAVTTLCLIALTFVLAVWYPSTFPLTRAVTTSAMPFTLVTSSYTISRWGGLLFATVLLVWGLKLGVLEMGLLAIVMTVVVPPIGRFVLRRSIRRSYLRIQDIATQGQPQ